MTERDRATVDVQPVRLDRKLAEAGDDLRGKGFVELDEVHLIERKAGEFQYLSNCRNGADPEALRLDACSREGDESRERLETDFTGAIPRHHQYGRRAVACLRRVACGHRAIDVERGPELRQRLHRRFATRPFVDPQLGKRNDLLCETAGVDRGEGALMRSQREAVLLLPRDGRFTGVVLRNEAGAEVDVRIVVNERRIGRDLVPAHRHEAHRFGAAGNDG